MYDLWTNGSRDVTLKGEHKVVVKFQFYTENSTKNFFNKEMIVAWVNLKISMSVK
jgi:hypothetical protein